MPTGKPTDKPLRGSCRPPPWSTALEGCALIAKGYTLRTAMRVAAVVGTILSAVNEGSVIASGRFGAITGVRIVTNFIVPFIVASIGYLAPFRRPRRTAPRHDVADPQQH